MFRPAWQDRLALSSAALGIAASLVLAGAWADVLPGGWRLRGLVEAHAASAARERALHAAQRLAAFASEDPAAVRDAVVFVGSSTIERCPLDAEFPGVRAVNRGIGWARADELGAHLDRLIGGGERAIVLYAGSPDRLDAPLDCSSVLDAVARLATAVRERAPSTPVLLLGLLPSGTTRGPEAEALARIDDGIARIAGEHGFQHVDFARCGLAGADGALDAALSADGLHLNRAGYAIFADRLRAAPEPFAMLLAD
jgi:lysophospholipase L1-like esterase